MVNSGTEIHLKRKATPEGALISLIGKMIPNSVGYYLSKTVRNKSIRFEPELRLLYFQYFEFDPDCSGFATWIPGTNGKYNIYWSNGKAEYNVPLNRYDATKAEKNFGVLKDSFINLYAWILPGKIACYRDRVYIRIIEYERQERRSRKRKRLGASLNKYLEYARIAGI